MTRSEENYLKAIYHLGVSGQHLVSTNALSEEMQTKPSSVTDMARRLSEKGLVNYKKYQGVQLTEEGKKVALSVIRKHRLWEVFLVERLDFNWDEVHEIAEQLEHIKSDILIDRLDAHLGYPRFDPHGDPIPDKDGLLAQRDKQLLSEMDVPGKGICVGVKDSSAPFLKYLDKVGIGLGKEIEILDREEFDQSLQLKIDRSTIQISHQIANNLYIKAT